MINIVLNKKKNQSTYKKKIVKMWKRAKNKNMKVVALENKIGQQNSSCVGCDSKISIFLKRVKTKKKGFHKLEKHGNLLFKL